jgi:hypothetical protein
MFCLKHVSQYEDDCLECIKDNAYEPFLTRYAFNSFDEKSYVGKFVRSDKVVPIYKEPGGAAVRFAQPKSYIGKVKGFNTKKTWLQLGEGAGNNWIFFNDGKDLTFETPDPNAKELTLKDKVDIAANVVSNTQGALAGALVKGAGNTAVAVEDILPDFSTIKWVLIGLLVIVVITMIYKMLK